tara:strand:- start:1864 stop:5832 length:3969 start_codon:yes stop_codon:yes gene_type:complete
MDQTNDEIVSSQLDEEMARLDELDKKEQEQREAQDAAEAAETKPDDLSPTMGRTAAKAREEEAPAVEEEPEEPEDTRVTGRESQERFFETGKEALQTAGNVLKTGNEVKNAIGAGTADWVADSLRVFGIKTPKYRKFDNEYAEAVREISSFVVPNIVLGAAGKAAGTALNTKVGWGIGQSKLMQLIGNTGVDVGTGVIVDVVNANTEEGDNLTGWLKKSFPKTFEFISDDIATIDGDHPDLKRKKSIYEGVGLGMFSALFEAAGTLARGRLGQKAITSFVSENERFDNLVKQINQAAEAGEVPEDTFTRAMKSQEEALDEIGAEVLSRATNLDETFSPGVLNEYGPFESGARTVDRGGVVGASVDAVRIQKNRGSRYGRLGSIVTEAAKKYGLEINNLTKRMVVDQITQTIKNAGKYSAILADGRPVNFEEIDAAGTLLAEVLVDPRMDSGMLKGVLDEYKDMINDLGKKAGVSKEVLGKTGYNAAMKAIKGYMDEFINMDKQKAAAYLTTSMAGEMSDIAEGLRYVEEAPEAIGRAQEMILDRMEYLMVEKGLAAYNWGASLNFLNTWKRFSDNPTILAKAGQNAAEQTDDALKNIINRAKNSANSLRAIAKERPQFLVPLQMAWEFSDGNIDTLSKLHNYINNSTGTISKAFIDLQPEIPSAIVQGAWANIYNSVLSAFSTPIKAFAGNTVLMLQKPISIFAGAAVSGDIKTLKRGAYQYMAVGDTFVKSWKHMSDVFRKASQDPTSVGYIMREELVYKNESQMDILHSFAEAAQRDGNDGPMLLYNMADTMQDIANHPWLRFGANAMTALDGFTRATLANIEARGIVYDRMIAKGEGDMLTRGQILDAEDTIYNSMFDNNGMITDKAVDFASREIALNLDTDNVRSLSGFLSRVPGLKPFLMFPRTADNMIGMVNKFSPVSVFIEDYNKMALPGMNFTTDQVKKLLDTRGIKYNNAAEMDQAFRTLRAEIRGRKAIGFASVLGAAFMFTNDRLHGNGHYDKERQKVRQQLKWKPRSYKGWDGKWYSYEFLGPMADFISVTADVMDNMDTIDQEEGSKLLNKVGFILGANLTNKSFLAGLEPMNDVLAGNPAAMARWGASFGSSLLPMSGARAELGRMMSPQLREVDQDIFQLFHNRNKWVDVINPDAALPTAYDWVDGSPVGYPEDFFTRMWNAVMPMKVSDGMTPERQFLLDIEFDSRPTFNKAAGGIDYTPSERSELFSLMGQQGYFKQELQRIMQTTDAKKWRESIKRHRADGSKIDEQLYANLYYEIERALRAAKSRAELDLSNRQEIIERRYQISVNEFDQRRGLPPTFPLTNR